MRTKESDQSIAIAACPVAGNGIAVELNILEVVADKSQRAEPFIQQVKIIWRRQQGCLNPASSERVHAFVAPTHAQKLVVTFPQTVGI